MSQVMFKGQPLQLRGVFPQAGRAAPLFTLTGADLSDVRLNRFAGKQKILSIVPSLDTSVCAASARKFNAEVDGLEHVVLLKISMDLPFAQKRFCDSEKLERLVVLSAFRYPAFGLDYGVQIADGPLAGLLARAVLVVDEHDQITYAQLVPDIGHEPDYAAVLQAVRG
ncbi:MAG: thiol peroxidase [Kiritimatiellaeota bacterium]|nr:thiol peroxidase [Kiritimatiellota bacterium]